MLIGGLLAPCNIYSALKVGWSMNVSVASNSIAIFIGGLASLIAAGLIAGESLTGISLGIRSMLGG